MPFNPISVPGRSISTAELRYRIRQEHGRPRLVVNVVQSLLNQVNGSPKFWRLDIDPKARRGRLTALIQTDNNPATRKGTQDGGKSIQFSWSVDALTAKLFPDTGRVTPLANHSITSMGIEFQLPEPEPEVRPLDPPSTT